MQIQTVVIGFIKSLSQASPISQKTEPAFSKPYPKLTKVSSITSSRGTFSPIAIELKIDGHRAISKPEACAEVISWDGPL